jgi:hypothetical protein
MSGGDKKKGSGLNELRVRGEPERGQSHCLFKRSRETAQEVEPGPGA